MSAILEPLQSRLADSHQTRAPMEMAISELFWCDGRLYMYRQRGQDDDHPQDLQLLSSIEQHTLHVEVDW